MGSSVAGKYLLVRYAPGTRTSTTAVMLCTNDSSERPMAQKYPLKQKCTPAKQQSRIYPRRYGPPAATTAASCVKTNWMTTEMSTPKPNATAMAYHSVCSARRGLPAPMHCAPSADTVESMDDGTRNRKLMIFSTMPTAAASVRPRRLAMTVMNKNAIWISPSCSAIGTPMRRMRPMIARCGRKSSRVRAMPPRAPRMTASDTATLTACASVVPSAAPAGPMCSAPMNR